MNVFPVFTRDLRAEMRSHRLRKERFHAAMIAGFILVALIVAERWAGGVSLTRLVAAVPFTGVGPFILLVIGLNRAGNLLSAERREGTLPLLLLTRLTGHDIMLGKLLHALLVEVGLFLATLPALILPLIALGFQWRELLLTALGCLNLIFFALALGLFGSVFGDGRKAASWCLILLFPLIVYSSPFARLLPAGAVREWLAAFQWLNPCDALAHAGMAAVGVRPGAYWSSLLGSHALAWGLITSAGILLPRACRWQAGINAGRRARKRWWPWAAHTSQRSLGWRTRLLDRNAVHWLTSRERWPTAQLWIWIGISGAGLGYLAWLGRGVGITIVLVLAVAAIWHIVLCVLIPNEASRRLVDDRHSGALEMILCTPIRVKELVRGQWLSLGCRYLPPIVIVMLSDTAMMIAGYVTFGFGGMLDPEDRGFWLFVWLAGILLLPLCITALSWVAMRRALFVRNAGEASGVAFVQVVGVPSMVLAGICALGQWGGWWIAIFFPAALTITFVVFARQARLILLRDLRHAATSRYFEDPALESRSVIRALWLWWNRTRSLPTA